MPSYSDNGPCYSDGVFSYSPGQGRGQEEEAGGSGLLFGRCYFPGRGGGVFFVLSRGQGQAGAADSWSI